MIYSKKYGRSFKNRAALQDYDWWDKISKPILPWWGLRDISYSYQYKKEHGLLRSGFPFWRIYFILMLWYIVFHG